MERAFLDIRSGDLKMTADQIRSLPPALYAMLEIFNSYFNLKRCSVISNATCRADGGHETQEHRADRLGGRRGGTNVAGIPCVFRVGHKRVEGTLRQWVMDQHGSERAIGVIDASARPKQGDKTPGVKRQACGEGVDHSVAVDAGEKRVAADYDLRNHEHQIVTSEPEL